VKRAVFPPPDAGPIPFLSFDDDRPSRQWAVDVAQHDGALLETVFERSSAASVVAGVLAGLSVAPPSARHVRPEMEIVRTRPPPPPDLVHVARRARKARYPALDSLRAEVQAEVARQGGPSRAV
jgi:DNA-binding transcriptional LysR family regulator